jgi:tetratricopeptide (TPR) repeat protein
MRLKMSKYAFLKSNASLVIICSLLGLAGGFKIANLQYHSERSVAKNREIAQAATGRQGAQAEISAILEKAKANPNNVEAQLDAADQFFRINRFQEGMSFVEQAKKADPNDWRVNAAFGIGYLMMEDYDRAIESLKGAREQKADNPGVTLALIDIYIKTMKNLDEAERLLREVETEKREDGTQKVDPATLAQFRAELDVARKAGKSSEAMKPKTTLSHGPEQPKVAK